MVIASLRLRISTGSIRRWSQLTLGTTTDLLFCQHLRAREAVSTSVGVDRYSITTRADSNSAEPAMSLHAAVDLAWRSTSPMVASVSRNCLRMTALLLGLILIITSALEGGLLSNRADVLQSTPNPGEFGRDYRPHPYDSPSFPG